MGGYSAATEWFSILWRASPLMGNDDGARQWPGKQGKGSEIPRLTLAKLHLRVTCPEAKAKFAITSYTPTYLIPPRKPELPTKDINLSTGRV